MSKRTQERKSEGEPAVAKPMSISLISRKLNWEQPSSLLSDASNVPANPQLYAESVLGGTGKLARDRDQNPATCSEERKEDNPYLGGYVNTTPQMTCFRGAKVCTKWLQESDDELIQSDNKMRIGTRSGKFIIVD